ncbi:5-(carboxyamino)imidazole ribonucleotide mutase [Proteiniclasticum sp. BAD-10]|uniref:N5-carboxyaminoimidazole ribonucleotide mutase n=1 Tax=Proteiniclasticum sediminis TaxID=2804028 RepID=A0A941CLM7_9CLOT|nr:5-(carboxyamino)imidazole ribonucleotide mutase [Proteiniclasticum sediminis]MBR0574815.1 5-(carboxyamino)imidazole ribonucleotide mutase [Proteiniclasticum sediminis]
MKVLILFGSPSDKSVMHGAKKALDEFGVHNESYALSAHRLPELLEEVLTKKEEEGFEVIIAGAGLAAHLPGVVASKTVLPVIGVPLKGALEGLDALFSIVQMPKQVPVATVGIGNAYNAGMLAVQILAVKYPELKTALLNYRKNLKEQLSAEYAQEVIYE